MVRVIGAGLLAGMMLCGCGQARPDPAPSPVPINLPALTQAYSEIAARPDEQIAQLSAKLEQDRSPDEYRATYAALATTLHSYEAGLLRMQFPVGITKDAKALITATAELEEITVILARSSNPTGFPDLTAELHKSLTEQLNAENAVRRDLGLPPRP